MVKVKLSLCTQKRCGGLEVYLHSYLTWALDLNNWSALQPGSFIPGQRTRLPTEQDAGQPVELILVLIKRQKFCPFRESKRDSSQVQTIAQPLHQLSYPDTRMNYETPHCIIFLEPLFTSFCLDSVILSTAALFLHYSVTSNCSEVLCYIGKGKVLPRAGHEGPDGEQRYRSTLYLTLALDGGGWSTPRLGRFTPGKETRYPLYRRLGRPQGRSGRLRKTSPPPGFDPQTVQLVASRYADYAISSYSTLLHTVSIWYVISIAFSL